VDAAALCAMAAVVHRPPPVDEVSKARVKVPPMVWCGRAVVTTRWTSGLCAAMVWKDATSSTSGADSVMACTSDGPLVGRVRIVCTSRTPGAGSTSTRYDVTCAPPSDTGGDTVASRAEPPSERTERPLGGSGTVEPGGTTAEARLALQLPPTHDAESGRASSSATAAATVEKARMPRNCDTKPDDDSLRNANTGSDGKAGSVARSGRRTRATGTRGESGRPRGGNTPPWPALRPHNRRAHRTARHGAVFPPQHGGG